VSGKISEEEQGDGKKVKRKEKLSLNDTGGNDEIFNCTKENITG